MKKIIICIALIMGLSSPGIEKPLGQTSIIVKQKYALFLPAYEKIRLHEGFYSDHKKDKGGETYGGVARNFNKEWYGWRHVDKLKSEVGKLPWNQKIKDAELWVLDYYLDVWVKEEFYKIQDQDVANYIFDFRINGIGSMRVIQRVLIGLNQDVKISGRMDEQTITAINRVNPQILLISIRDRRVKFYKNIVKRDITQDVFLDGWLKRANKINAKLTPNKNV